MEDAMNTPFFGDPDGRDRLRRAAGRCDADDGVDWPDAANLDDDAAACDAGAAGGGASDDDVLASEPHAPGVASRRLPAAPDEPALVAWMDGVVEHDEQAFGALYDATFARVHAFVLRITRHAALAEEVVEDCFWQVWREAPRFDAARGRVLGWILTIARSRALDAMRRHQRTHCREVADDLAVDLHADPGADPQDLLDATQGHHALHAALAGLPATQRQLLSLAFFRGMTHDEIAEHTGMPLGTVKSHLRRTLALLRERLGAVADETPAR
jgi:RNA polymerase sigma-70 factor (ECF subfamily)